MKLVEGGFWAAHLVLVVLLGRTAMWSGGDLKRVLRPVGWGLDEGWWEGCGWEMAETGR